MESHKGHKMSEGQTREAHLRRFQKHESYKVTIIWFVRAILYRLSGKAGPVLFMIKNRQTPNKTICNILNDIYHRTKDKKTKLMAMEASFMAKRMANRLEVYKHNEAKRNRQ